MHYKQLVHMVLGYKNPKVEVMHRKYMPQEAGDSALEQACSVHSCGS